MSLINVSNLTFSYSDDYDNVFENVSFQIDTNWRLGFIGRNGRGKTTFFRILSGELEYKGKITSTVSFEYFPYNLSDVNQYTIDIIRNISYAEDWEIYRELSYLELSDDILYREFFTLSNGEQTKALLAAMFLKRNSFLLIDEPTNHLDAYGRELLSQYLNRKKGFILISHDRSFLDGCIDHVLSINRRNIEIQKGNYSSWQYNKDLKDNFELSQNAKLKKDIKRLSEAADKVSKWSESSEKSKFGTRNSGLRPDRGYIGHKSAKMMSRSLNIKERVEKSLNEKSELLKNYEETEDLKISVSDFYANRILALDNISVKYNGKTICSGISFDINRGEKVVLQGRNGCGKSSILKLICGDNIDYDGNLYKSAQLKISYIPQDVSDLHGTIEDFALKRNIDLSQLLTILKKLGFDRKHFLKDIGSFSEGQKKKTAVAASFCTPAHIYIWDEPLNYIDIISRIQIENAVMKYSPTLLLVEHDEAFCEKIADKIIIIK